MGRLAVLMKGYPRLSETFIAQEILGLQERGLEQVIYAMRKPYDPYIHPVHRRITAPVVYLPEYLKDDPDRVKKARDWAKSLPHYEQVRSAFLKDLERDRTACRHRRWGQACVMAYELPEDISWIHSHYLHTPCTVARYAAMLAQKPWSFSAHAKDIWTSDPNDLVGKLNDAQWGVTCTKANLDYLSTLCKDPSKLSLVYHGLDTTDFSSGSKRYNNASSEGVTLVSVGRLVEKKGYDLLLDALAQLPSSCNWQLNHIGAGELSDKLKAKAVKLGIAQRINWLGAQPRTEVIRRLSEGDIFVLPCRIARSGDRDGLPNVLMEAQVMGLACVSTRVSAIPELITDEETGLLVEPNDAPALSEAIARLASDKSLRQKLGEAGAERVKTKFQSEHGIDQLSSKFAEVL
ncbi:colanic acid biosynthesis glycosyltransferase WcaL [Rhodobacteraceae bacterium RKSG542]|uniref:glycosyltransferase family 4 protein n=1 Tax=Pseudovibrio flavus TaxID=2529854 RepID=UPI0012BD07A5|nr:glycosyltransferase family 4 protein [Pseudovibrio flavus]MTI17025.1 colanic acid biosynthesis glycosyltransferase WcaL [Pseudovibrio flavus]